MNSSFARVASSATARASSAARFCRRAFSCVSTRATSSRAENGLTR